MDRSLFSISQLEVIFAWPKSHGVSILAVNVHIWTKWGRRAARRRDFTAREFGARWVELKDPPQHHPANLSKSFA